MKPARTSPHFLLIPQISFCFSRAPLRRLYTPLCYYYYFTFNYKVRGSKGCKYISAVEIKDLQKFPHFSPKGARTKFAGVGCVNV
jgi:hypothetical protein